MHPLPFLQSSQGKATDTVNGEPGSAVTFTYSFVHLKFFFPFPVPGLIPLTVRGKGGNGKTNSSVKGGKRVSLWVIVCNLVV